MKVLFYDKVYDTEKDTIDTIKDDLSKRLEIKEGYLFPFYISVDEKARTTKFYIMRVFKDEVNFEDDTIYGADATMLLGKPLPAPCLFGFDAHFEKEYFADVFKADAKDKEANRVKSIDITENDVMVGMIVSYGK